MTRTCSALRKRPGFEGSSPYIWSWRFVRAGRRCPAGCLSLSSSPCHPTVCADLVTLSLLFCISCHFSQSAESFRSPTSQFLLSATSLCSQSPVRLPALSRAFSQEHGVICKVAGLSSGRQGSTLLSTHGGYAERSYHGGHGASVLNRPPWYGLGALMQKCEPLAGS